MTRLEFDPNDPTRLYAVLGGYAGGGAAGHVFRTTLGASQWTDISPAASIDDVLVQLDVPFGALALDGSDLPTTIYVGCDLGVLRSVNDGASWMVVDDIHLPRVPVTDLAISGSQHPKTLRVATYGRGVFQFVKPDWPAIAVTLEEQLEFGTVCPAGDHLTIEVANVGEGAAADRQHRGAARLVELRGREPAGDADRHRAGRTARLHAHLPADPAERQRDGGHPHLERRPGRAVRRRHRDRPGRRPGARRLDPAGRGPRRGLPRRPSRHAS